MHIHSQSHKAKQSNRVVKSAEFITMAAHSFVLTVSRDGTGHYRTVQEAIDAVPLGNTRRTVIRVSPGIYRQPLYVPKTKNLITLAGLSPEDTVLSWKNTATRIQHPQVGTTFLIYVLY